MTKISPDRMAMNRGDDRRDRSSTGRAGQEWMRALRGLVGGLVIIVAAALVACSGSSKGTATSAPSTVVALPALGVQLPAGQIPWKQVGPGWILATWSPAPGLGPGQTPPPGQPIVAPVTLYLLDPAGERYAIATFPLLPPVGPGDPGHTPMLANWSADGRHALLMDYGTAASGHTTMTEVDLATGAQQSFTAGEGTEPAYSRPTGQTILLSTFLGYQRGWTLERVDLRGTKQVSFPTDLGAAGKFNGRYLESPDGTQLVLGTSNGLVVVGNDGVVARALPLPGPLANCSPVRWWTSTVILARCGANPSAMDMASQLWRVSLAGGAPTAFTAVNTGQQDSGFGHGQDLGDDDAWQLPGGTFLQSEAGCGPGFLSRLTPDLHTTPVTVPGVDSGHSVVVTGATADKLVLRATMGCGSGTSLLTYDPAANTSTVLLGPPVNGGSVQNAILYPTP